MTLFTDEHLQKLMRAYSCALEEIAGPGLTLSQADREHVAKAVMAMAEGGQRDIAKIARYAAFVGRAKMLNVPLDAMILKPPCIF